MHLEVRHELSASSKHRDAHSDGRPRNVDRGRGRTEPDDSLTTTVVEACAHTDQRNSAGGDADHGHDLGVANVVAAGRAETNPARRCGSEIAANIREKEDRQ